MHFLQYIKVMLGLSSLRIANMYSDIYYSCYYFLIERVKSKPVLNTMIFVKENEKAVVNISEQEFVVEI